MQLTYEDKPTTLQAGDCIAVQHGQQHGGTPITPLVMFTRNGRRLYWGSDNKWFATWLETQVNEVTIHDFFRFVASLMGLRVEIDTKADPHWIRATLHELKPAREQ
jgi:hypothetical protein